MKLILLPGIYGTDALFDDFLAYLPPSVETQALPLPAHGRQSYSRLTELVARSLPVAEDYVLLAESYSCVIAKKITALRPGNLRGLILVSAFFSCPNPVLKFGDEWLPFRMVQRCARSRWLLRLFGADAQTGPEVLEQISAAMAAIPADVLRSRLDAIVALPVNDGSRIEIPACYLQPTQDRIVVESCVREVRNTLREGLVCKVEAPHFALQAQPAVCASIANHFLARLPERSIRSVRVPREDDEYRIQVIGSPRQGGAAGRSWTSSSVKRPGPPPALR